MHSDVKAPLARITSVSHYSIDVADLRESIKFYREVLGLKVIVDNASDPALPSIKGVLGDFAVEIAERPIGTGQGGTPHNTLRPCLSLTTQDLPSIFVEFKAAGVPALAELQTFRGAYFFQFDDPDGYRIELIELPHGSRSLGELLASRQRQPGGAT
jgi:catechol 2,3-dioxygenase-like lactoylglutathione lyase family enzyme